MKIVIVEKTGIVKTQNVKNFEIDNLYKKCLFRKADDFSKRHTWTVKIGNKTYNVSLYAKTKGKATTENKYDLPPPIDSTMYYGSMAIVNFDKKDGDETDAVDFTSEEWDKIYEKFFSKELLNNTSKIGSILGGHPEYSKVPGVEVSTGALGHGMPIGVGMALAAKIRKQKHKIYVIVGDGEINEGSIWESAMSASKHSLSNLKVFVDYNKIQSYGPTKDVLDLEPLVDKWKSFGFDVSEVNGHDINQLKKNIFKFKKNKIKKPSVTICHTIKGKGFYFAENNPYWHHKNSFKDEEIQDLNNCLE
mgnify:CR=1 FL=1